MNKSTIKPLTVLRLWRRKPNTNGWYNANLMISFKPNKPGYSPVLNSDLVQLQARFDAPLSLNSHFLHIPSLQNQPPGDKGVNLDILDEIIRSQDKQTYLDFMPAFVRLDLIQLLKNTSPLDDAETHYLRIPPDHLFSALTIMESANSYDDLDSKPFETGSDLFRTKPNFRLLRLNLFTLKASLNMINPLAVPASKPVWA